MTPKSEWIAIRVTPKELKTMRKFAKKYTDGNVSAWLRRQALTMPITRWSGPNPNTDI